MKFWLFWILLVSVAPAWAALPAETTPVGECVVVSGGPALQSWERYRFKDDVHDRWYFNFIRPARVRIEQVQRFYPGSSVAWLVYRPGYERRQREEGKPLISDIESVRDKYGVKLVWFSSGEEVINYLNRGQDRRRTKVVSFDFFGHSNKHCFLFDYSNHILGVSKAYLHEDDLGRINRNVFASNAHAKSWGCHTAESMSVKWRRATGSKLWGAVGKTDYAKMPVNGWLPALSPGGHWRY